MKIFTYPKYILLILLLTMVTVSAKRLDSGTSSSRDLITLIVIGENQEGIALANIIRQKTKQPTLIYKGNEAIFIGAYNKAIKIPLKDVASFVRFSHPRYIIALGSHTDLPKAFVQSLKPTLKSYHFSTNNWSELALQMNIFFSNNRISSAFLNRFPSQ